MKYDCCYSWTALVCMFCQNFCLQKKPDIQYVTQIFNVCNCRKVKQLEANNQKFYVSYWNFANND